MKSNKNILIFRVLMAVIILGITAYLVFNESGLLKYLKLKKEVSTLRTQIEQADQILHSLKLEIDSLQTSKAKIEQVARERFDMKSKDETVIRFIEN